MRSTLARLGGGLLVAGSVAFLLVVAVVIGGRPAGTGFPSVGGLAVDLGLAFVGTGSGLIAGTGQWPAGQRITRIGLAILAIGCAAFTASSIALRLGDSSLATLLLQVILALPVTLLGFLIIGVTLLQEPDASRSAGRALVAGVAALVPYLAVANMGGVDLQLGGLVAPILAIAALLLIAGIGGLGYLALGYRWSWREPAADPPSSARR
jgi:hypothetical protein